jgi:hypothetical protein
MAQVKLTADQTLGLLAEMTAPPLEDSDDGSNVLAFDERGNLMLNGCYIHLHEHGVDLATFAPDACARCGQYHPENPVTTQFAGTHNQVAV